MKTYYHITANMFLELNAVSGNVAKRTTMNFQGLDYVELNSTQVDRLNSEIQLLSNPNEFEIQSIDIQFVITGNYSRTTYPIEHYQEMKIQEAKSLASQILSQTDYIIIRQAEQSTLSEAEYNEVKTERQSIRDRFNAIITEINALTTKQEVYFYTINF